MPALAAVALALPLIFAPNFGQADSQVRFTAVTRGYTLELSDTAIAINARGSSVQLKFPQTKAAGVEEVAAKSNYYFGSDASKWRTGVPNFGRIRYRDVFRGIDLVVYGHDDKVEYDWVVAPGADPQAIHFSIAGASQASIDSKGDLVLETANAEVRQTRPRILQGGREVAGRFVLKGNYVRFEVSDYDRRKPLTIDPVLVISASLGGQTSFPAREGLNPPIALIDAGTGVATDSSGNIYVTGITYSISFPVVNPIQSAPSTNFFSSIFVTKLAPNGTSILYSTYIGPTTPGPSLPSAVSPAIAADPSGNVYLTGAASGANFPGVTTTAGGNDAFLMRLDPKGAFLGVLLFGGSGDDRGTSIVYGQDGSIYLAGLTASSNFPTTQGAYKTTSVSSANPPYIVFATRISFESALFPIKGTAIYTALLGPGSSAAIAVDANSGAYIAASTSGGWQTTPGVVQPTCAGSTCADAVVAKLDPAGQKLVFSTYLGGSLADYAHGIAVDASDSVYICGSTSSPDFPTTAGVLGRLPAIDIQHSASTGAATGFVAKLNPTATKLTYATYLGGSVGDSAMAIAVDNSGNAYVGGATSSSDLPLLNAFQSTPYNRICPVYLGSETVSPAYYLNCASAGFLSVLNPTATILLWSTYLGSGSVNAVAVDGSSNVYATGDAINVNQNGAAGVLKVAPGTSILDVPANAIVNGASFAPGLPLPGGLASVFLRGVNVSSILTGTGSPLSTSLGGVSILVDGVPAPILALAPLSSGQQQINFQVPFEATTNKVEIRYNGASVFAYPQTVAPGVFILSNGAAALEHGVDYSLITQSNPAKPGELILIYATGLGQVNPAVVTGEGSTGPANVVQPCGGVTVTTPSGGTVGTILYAGLTPGFVGLYQIDLQLSLNVTLPAQLVLQESVCTSFGMMPFSLGQSNIFTVP